MAVYKKIAGLLLQHLQSGEYPEGKYPSLRKIAADMGCSYVTAVRAMHYLQEQDSMQPEHSSPLVAMISPHWNFTIWHRAVRKSVMELGGQLRFVTYSSEIDPIIAQTLNEKFDLIFLMCPLKPNTPLFKVVRKNKSRVVVLFQDLTKFGIRCMEGIPDKIILTIMEDLARHEIRRIDMIGHEAPDTEKSLQEMWQEGLQKIGGTGRFYCYPHTSFNEEAGECYHYLQQQLEIKNLPEAFFCCNTACAQGLYRFLFDHALVPGKDISVFSFGERTIAETMTPPLAVAVDVGLEEMVKQVVSEYAEGKISQTMMFKLPRAAYIKSRSLVPFQKDPA